MKRIFKGLVTSALAVMLMVSSLVGCASKGKTLMKLDGEKISVNTVMLFMSRMKGTLASASVFGSEALKDEFWDTIIDANAKTTYDTYYTDTVLDSARTYLAALAYFDELGLKLPKETEDEIDAELRELVDYDGEGSKTAFNALLADYGANYKILRDAYIMEAKLAYLNDYLFGSDGSLIAAENYDKYYEENYVRFRQIFFFTTKPVYQTDENGDEIYYSDLSNGIIAYKTDGANKKADNNGAWIKDKNGEFVYFYTDSDGKEHISYDKKGTEENPTQRNPITDTSGNVMTEALTKAEMIKLSDKVQLIMEDEAKEGEYTLFDKLIEDYGEDEGMEQYPNGYYMTSSSQYDAPEVVEALFEMEVGEIRRVESDYGIHIVMKYPLEDGGYASEENADFFRSEDGTYVFLGTLKSQLLEQYVADYKANIVIDEERRKELSMKNVGANYNY